jgi:hypothetical protein
LVAIVMPAGFRLLGAAVFWLSCHPLSAKCGAGNVTSPILEGGEGVSRLMAYHDCCSGRCAARVPLLYIQPYLCFYCHMCVLVNMWRQSARFCGCALGTGGRLLHARGLWPASAVL